MPSGNPSSWPSTDVWWRIGWFVPDQPRPLWTAGGRFQSSLQARRSSPQPHVWWGEGTSALALLFSIIRVKPFPLSSWDEVGSWPWMRPMSNVLVTTSTALTSPASLSSSPHRKGTMSTVDAIYGVTMQESGVSKIVSVKLKDIDKM